MSCARCNCPDCRELYPFHAKSFDECKHQLTTPCRSGDGALYCSDCGAKRWPGGKWEK